MADDRAHATADTLDANEAGASAPYAGPDLRPGTVVAERYEIERMLGAGGMGTVYLAHDRTLDRRVALKVHRAAANAERLRREAIAMAKLSHPNVIVVYEVGEIDKRPFVAMEYIPGETLRAWAEKHSWREVLRALLAAGEGLAAVHAAGLVHRDVKPDNILVGRDGRARIGDFGLASLPLTEPAPDDTADVALTATGTIVGTPAYMSPEQLEGAAVDARTDQFAFCVAAWELLTGTRPFPGETLQRIRGAIDRGEIEAGNRRIAAGVRRVLERGLAADPAVRHASMPALLAALRTALKRPQVIAAAATGGLVVAGIAAWLLWPASDPLAVCATAGRDIDELVPTAAIEQVVHTVHETSPSAPADRVTRAGELFRSTYRTLAHDACVAEVRGQWSRELAAAARECRTYQAQTAREMLVAATTEKVGPADAVQVALALPDLGSCGDARLLAGWQPLANDQAQLSAIVGARARLDAAMLLVDLGRGGHVPKTLAEIAAQPVAKDPAIAGRLALLSALAARSAHDFDGTEQQLADVYLEARGREDGELALRAVGYLIDTAIDIRRDPAAAQRWARDGLAEADRAAARWPSEAAAVYGRAAAAANEAGDPDRALQLLDHATKLVPPRSAANDWATFSLRSDALLMQGKLEQALAANAETLRLVREQLGDVHPVVAHLLSQRANMLLEANRGKEADDVVREALEILGHETSDSVSRAATETNLGAILVDQEDPRGREVLEHARKFWVEAFGEDHPDIATIDTNLALLANDAGDHDKAITLLEHAVKVDEKMLGPDHTDLGPPLFNLAVSQRDARKLDDARATARRCAAIYGKHQPTSLRRMSSLVLVGQIERMRGDAEAALASDDEALAVKTEDVDTNAQAWARLEAAQALIALHRDRARTKALLVEARALYEKVPLPKRVAEIDQLLGTLR